LASAVVGAKRRFEIVWPNRARRSSEAQGRSNRHECNVPNLCHGLTPFRLIGQSIHRKRHISRHIANIGFTESTQSAQIAGSLYTTQTILLEDVRRQFVLVGELFFRRRGVFGNGEPFFEFIFHCLEIPPKSLNVFRGAIESKRRATAHFAFSYVLPTTLFR
jgi:hypothetical protein